MFDGYVNYAMLKPVIDYLTEHEKEKEEISLSFEKIISLLHDSITKNDLCDFEGKSWFYCPKTETGWNFYKIDVPAERMIFKRKYTAYENKLVAFVDILGFSKIIEESKDAPASHIKRIIKYLHYIKAWESNGENNWSTQQAFYYDPVFACASNQNLEDYNISEITNCTCVSDCMIITVPVEDSNFHQRLSSVVEKLAYIGNNLIQAGFVIRGGMSIGPVIHTKGNILFGPAYLEAYRLEENKAIFPLVILSDDLEKKIDKNFSNPKYPYQNYLVKFNDEKYGFDQLQYFQALRKSKSEIWNDTPLFKDEVMRAKNVIERNLFENRNNIHILEKYIFLKNRFNSLNLPQDIKENISDEIMK